MHISEGSYWVIRSLLVLLTENSKNLVGIWSIPISSKMLYICSSKEKTQWCDAYFKKDFTE